MKHVNNQQGYALLIVLLMVVLFLSISATFMAGSLNNATQERTVDTTNQSVAAAEMGVRYFTSDFQRELEIIKQDISIQTQTRVNELIACIQPPRGALCDSDTKIELIEADIDKEMKQLYIDSIFAKVNALNPLPGTENPLVPFSPEQIEYLVESASGKKINAAGENTQEAAVSDKVITNIRVDLVIKGKSKEIDKKLQAFFTVEVPETFLDEDKPLTVETKTEGTKDDLKYTDIFDQNLVEKSCVEVLAEAAAEGSQLTPLYECKLDNDYNIEKFIKDIETAGMDPKDFKVYTDSFAGNICTNQCNSLKFKGIHIVVKPEDEVAFNNMNSLNNAFMIVDGTLLVGKNLNNAGKKPEVGENGEIKNQTIIMKEMNVGKNIQNLEYTNLLILGRVDPLSNTEAISKLEWGENQKFVVSHQSRLCIDIDRILPDDILRLAKDIEFKNAGQLIYYTENNENFDLLDKNENVDTVNTGLYVKKMSPPNETYTTFLAACGVTVSDIIEESTEVSIPSVLDPGFDLEVEY